MTAPIADAALAQAITWLVRLRSGETSEADWKACATWRADSPSHEAAWQALQRSEMPFELAANEAPLALRVLEKGAHSQPSRRQALKMLGLCSVAAGSGWLALDAAPWRNHEYATATGQRSRFTLADGSLLHLNTDSAADLLATTPAPHLLLHNGQLQVERRISDSPALQVRSGSLQLFAEDARFDLQRQQHQQRLTVLRGSVALLGAGPTLQRVSAGEQYLIDNHGVHPWHDATLLPGTWVDGQLVVRRMPLPRLLAELSRYRRGWLQCAPELATLPVSGVFQLDDIEQTLDALSAALPVRAYRLSKLWVRLVPA